MQLPKYVINVWPKKNSGIKSAVVKISFGGVFGIFPVRIGKGKGGGMCLFLPQGKKDKVSKWPQISILDAKAKKEIISNIEKTYRPEKPTCREFNSDQPISIEYSFKYRRIPVFDADFKLIGNMVAYAIITINGIIRFNDIRLFEYESGARVIRFPEKVIHKNGDYEFKRIIDFQKTWEEMISIDIWDAYYGVTGRKAGKEVR